MWVPQKPWQGQRLGTHGAGVIPPQLSCRKPQLEPPGVVPGVVGAQTPAARPLGRFQTWSRGTAQGVQSRAWRPFKYPQASWLPVQRSGWRRKGGDKGVQCHRPSTFLWVEVGGEECWKLLDSQGPTEGLVWYPGSRKLPTLGKSPPQPAGGPGHHFPCRGTHQGWWSPQPGGMVGGGVTGRQAPLRPRLSIHRWNFFFKENSALLLRPVTGWMRPTPRPLFSHLSVPTSHMDKIPFIATSKLLDNGLNTWGREPGQDNT